MNMKERVLVVGANGFIGTHLVNELIANKIPVTALLKNNASTNNLKKIGCYNILQSNNLNDSSLIRQLQVSKPKYIINCLWETTKDDRMLALKNTQLLTELLELSSQINCENFINLGTYQEYGLYREDIVETSKSEPETDLGKLKYAQSLILFQIAKSLNLKACHLRLAEVYSIDKPEKFIYNLLIKEVANGLNKKFSFPIEKKDYIFVTDVCRAIIFLIKSNAEGIFNVGSGKSFLSKDLMSMILQQYASNIVIDHTENNKSQDFSLNIDKIFNASGWKPNISIWDGITMLLQEEKFKNPATFSNFTKTIRSFYK